jgi:hypothetical protein
VHSWTMCLKGWRISHCSPCVFSIYFETAFRCYFWIGNATCYLYLWVLRKLNLTENNRTDPCWESPGLELLTTIFCCWAHFSLSFFWDSVCFSHLISLGLTLVIAWKDSLPKLYPVHLYCCLSGHLLSWSYFKDFYFLSSKENWQIIEWQMADAVHPYI